MKKKIAIILGTLITLAIIGIIICSSYSGFIKSHTFTLSGEDIVKNEQIQPVNGKVKVSGSADTDVVFTDIESGETYTIGYITPGAPGTIQLEKEKWYIVKGFGELTIRPVNVRVE